jgi:GWxTD domain-containing protein
MERNAKKRAFVLLFALGLAVPAARGQVREKDLGAPYRDWLKLVSYIVLPAEREVFMKLASDRDRDIFIDAFWKQRDPTPATPQNEFKEEHLRRFRYANTNLDRGTPREGWMTDMGRTYIVLGQANSIERFDATLGIHPCQVWYYFGDRSKGLPTYFGLLFFQRGGGGEYKLYNPTSDGPASLLVDTRKIDPMNTQQVYEKIKQLAPTLAGPAVSLIPNEASTRYAPSLQSSIILAQIFDSPKKNVSPSYATHFLDYKGIVSTEYLTNYIESSAAVAVIRDSLLGVSFVHFSIAPRTISIDYYEPQDRYYCNFKLSVSLRRGDTVVFQYSRDFPFYFPPDQLGNIRGNGVSVLDLFPVAEGKYGLTILLQNSVGKEFTTFEGTVEVPPDPGRAGLAEPVIGYRVQAADAGAYAPFKALDRQILADPKSMLGLSDAVAFLINVLNVPPELRAEGRVEAAVAQAQSPDKPLRSFGFRLADQAPGRDVSIVQTFPARDLPPDYYELKVSLKNGRGEVLDTVTGPFGVSTAETVPHPVTLVRAVPFTSGFFYHFGLAYQYDKIGDTAKAEAHYRKGHEMKPDYAEGTAEFADFLLRTGKPDEALGLADTLGEGSNQPFTRFLIRGRALMGKAEFGPAVEALLEGNRIYDSDTRLLNALGFCYFKLGRKKEALDALSASLRLNPEQPEAKELAARVEKELR